MQYKLSVDPHESVPPIPTFDRIFDHLIVLGYTPDVTGPAIIKTTRPLILSDSIGIYNRFGVFLDKI